MDIKAEKIELARMLLGIENEGVIRRIRNILMEETSDWWDELPDNVRATVSQAEKDIDEGKGIPHSEVVKKYAARLNRSVE